MKNLVLLRHGESQWNLSNRFTGWRDIDLTEQGRQEAQQAGIALKEAGLVFDIAYTSVLKRAIRTLWITLDELDQMWLPVQRHWQLNERHYGGLEGLNKQQTAQQHGDEQVKIWRRSFDKRPPELPIDDPHHPTNQSRYATISRDALPSCESLKDVMERCMPLWQSVIQAQLQRGSNVLIVAHGNTLRALVMHLDSLSPQDIMEINIPTGIPLWYQLDDTLKPISSMYIGDQQRIQAKQQQVAAQGKST